MAIEYVEIRNKDREIIGIIDTAQSIIWHSIYYGVGDFEIYIHATPEHLDLLKTDYFVTRPDNDEVGIIEKLEITNNAQDGLMIAASGRFAKSLLDRRLIYNLSGTSNRATILRGNVEANIRSVVTNNAINCPFSTARNISLLQLGSSADLPAIIVDEYGHATQKQVSYGNLLEYTDGVLQEYEYSSKLLLDNETGKLSYICFAGTDRSVDNSDGNSPIIFSREYDNLNDSNYSADKTPEKNFALIGGEGEGVERFYVELNSERADLERRELWVDAASISKTIEGEGEEQQEYTDEEYAEMLKAHGKQTLSTTKAVEAFSGSLNISLSPWKLNEDFALGDVVTVQDNQIGKYANARIVSTTEIQDENGYTVEVEYE